MIVPPWHINARRGVPCLIMRNNSLEFELPFGILLHNNACRTYCGCSWILVGQGVLEALPCILGTGFAASPGLGASCTLFQKGLSNAFFFLVFDIDGNAACRILASLTACFTSLREYVSNDLTISRQYELI
jgi:hypothetical protein